MKKTGHTRCFQAVLYEGQAVQAVCVGREPGVGASSTENLETMTKPHKVVCFLLSPCISNSKHCQQ